MLPAAIPNWAASVPTVPASLVLSAPMRRRRVGCAKAASTAGSVKIRTERESAIDQEQFKKTSCTRLLVKHAQVSATDSSQTATYSCEIELIMAH